MTRGAPEDDEHDAERLAQWLELVPTAPSWLRSRLGVTLTGTPDDLVPLWTAAMPLGAFASPDEPYEALPAWAQWPQVSRPGHVVGRLSAPWVEILGALAAYYGELLRAAAPSPGVAWEVLRFIPLQALATRGASSSHARQMRAATRPAG